MGPVSRKINLRHVVHTRKKDRDRVDQENTNTRSQQDQKDERAAPLDRKGGVCRCGSTLCSPGESQRPKTCAEAKRRRGLVFRTSKLFQPSRFPKSRRTLTRAFSFLTPPRHPTPIGQVMTSPRICNAFCPIRQLSELRRHQYNHPKRGSEVVAQANSEVRFVCLVFTLSRSRTCCSLGFI
jgi:hypothetical protein